MKLTTLLTAASALATGWAAKKLSAVPDPVLVVTTATFESAVELALQ